MGESKYRSGQASRALNTKPEAYFRDAYDSVMYSGVIGVYSRFVHWLMERRYKGLSTPTVLELGAGAGQHLAFVKNDFTTYIETDIDPELSLASCADPRVERRVVDAGNLGSVDSNSIDRLIATCLLAHLDSPVTALEEWRRVVKSQGYLTIYLPTEPGWLLRTLRRLFVAPKSRRYGQDHMVLVAEDHRNNYLDMSRMIKEVFGRDQVSRARFPLPLITWHLSLFEIVHIVVDKRGG